MISGRPNIPAGIGTFKYTWIDNNGSLHTELLEYFLYFPQSPINIISVTDFTRQLDDKEATGIDTKMLYSKFYWKNNKLS